jgi:hypothetical protein
MDLRQLMNPVPSRSWEVVLPSQSLSAMRARAEEPTADLSTFWAEYELAVGEHGSERRAKRRRLGEAVEKPDPRVGSGGGNASLAGGRPCSLLRDDQRRDTRSGRSSDLDAAGCYPTPTNQSPADISSTIREWCELPVRTKVGWSSER